MATIDNAVEWREIPEFPDYQVSSDGRIQRVTPPRNGRGYRWPLPHELKLKKHYKKGYLYIDLWCRNKEKYVSKTVHRLVLLAFAGHPPTKKHEACHNDGDLLNNRLENLRWGTRKENVSDTIKHGTWIRGTSCHFSKLTPDLVCQIRSTSNKRGHRSEMAASMNISIRTINDVLSGKTWKHVK